MDRILKLCAIPIAALLLFGGSMARADAIRPWSGASASARVFVPSSASSTQSGATASASSANTMDVSYEPRMRPWLTFSVPVTGSASAQATGRADGLLRVDADYSAPNPGSSPFIPDGTTQPVEAAANWSGDRVLIHSSTGSGLPTMVRLNVAVDFAAGSYVDFSGGALTFGQVGVTANSLSATITGGFNSSNGRFGTTSGSLAFDTASPAGSFYTDASGRQYHETFHLDLPVSASGVSNPFSLGLSASPLSELVSNARLFSEIKDATLSLTSITTTDGRLLSDLGDSVTFTSGMLAPGVQPMPIPEPSSVVIMLIAAVGLSRCFRR